MSWLSRLFGGRPESELKPQRLDYLNEALALERSGDFDAAITSYRLALRAKPDDTKVLQNLAIALTRVNRLEEAIKCYRQALSLKPALSGPHTDSPFSMCDAGRPMRQSSISRRNSARRSSAWNGFKLQHFRTRINC